jgi:hypothetical protein
VEAVLTHSFPQLTQLLQEQFLTLKLCKLLAVEPVVHTTQVVAVELVDIAITLDYFFLVDLQLSL